MKFCMDRKEGTVAVCLSEDPSNEGEVFNFSMEIKENGFLLSLEEGTLFEATVEDGRVVQYTVLAEETQARRDEARARLHALFARKKKG